MGKPMQCRVMCTSSPTKRMERFMLGSHQIWQNEYGNIRTRFSKVFLQNMEQISSFIMKYTMISSLPYSGKNKSKTGTAPGKCAASWKIILNGMIYMKRSINKMDASLRWHDAKPDRAGVIPAQAGTHFSFNNMDASLRWHDANGKAGTKTKGFSLQTGSI